MQKGIWPYRKPLRLNSFSHGGFLTDMSGRLQERISGEASGCGEDPESFVSLSLRRYTIGDT